jgi:hypothetical protein
MTTQTKSVAPVFGYQDMSREELIRHVLAYAESIHDLADRCMKAEGRLQMIQRNVLQEDGVKS